MKTVMYKRLLAMFAAVAAFTAFSLTASAQDYEYEPGEGYHEEEWYDPSDWDLFQDEDRGVDYERRDWYEFGYDYYDDDLYYDDDYLYYDDDYRDYYDYDDDEYAQDILYDDEEDTGWFVVDYDYDYWTDDWEDEETDFDVWYFD